MIRTSVTSDSGSRPSRMRCDMLPFRPIFHFSEGSAASLKACEEVAVTAMRHDNFEAQRSASFHIFHFFYFGDFSLDFCDPRLILTISLFLPLAILKNRVFSKTKACSASADQTTSTDTPTITSHSHSDTARDPLPLKQAPPALTYHRLRTAIFLSRRRP
jgi:hypothetical protein